MKYKLLQAQSKQTETLEKQVKATVYVENTQIPISGNYLKQVGRERTSGNPGRHHREVHNIAGRLQRI